MIVDAIGDLYSHAGLCQGARRSGWGHRQHHFVGVCLDSNDRLANIIGLLGQ